MFPEELHRETAAYHISEAVQWCFLLSPCFAEIFDCWKSSLSLALWDQTRTYRKMHPSISWMLLCQTVSKAVPRVSVLLTILSRSENVIVHKGSLPSLRIVGCFMCLMMTCHKISPRNVIALKVLGIAKSCFICISFSLGMYEYWQWYIYKACSILIWL